jgi:intraflagellar transport protein 74
LPQDLTFKERQMESSKTTQDRLESELNKRNQELEKINTLDTKITVELNSLTTKMKQMTREMTDFDNVWET